MTGQSGNTQPIMKMLVLAAIFFVGTSGTASAQKFNSLIPNPFVFCSAPKPCKLCHPWRAIYNEICANKINPEDTTEKYDQSRGTEGIETMELGSEEVSINGGETVEGLDVVSGPSGGKLVEGLDVSNNPIREVQ